MQTINVNFDNIENAIKNVIFSLYRIRVAPLILKQRFLD